jgi:hypothetical protein
MQRDRLNIGTTLRVASLALALGPLASPAAAQTYGDWNAMNGGHSADGTGGGAGGESGSGAATEMVMPYERNTSGRTVTGRAYRGYDGRYDGNTSRAYRGYDDVDVWNDGTTR